MLTDMVAMRPAGYFSVENATSNGGDASRVGFFSSLVPWEKMLLLFSRVRIHILSLSLSIPTRDASPPLELAFRASVLLEVAFRAVHF